MKILKITPLLFVFMLPACNTTPDTTGWNTTELALIKEHVHGIEVPYMYIEGNKQLFYQDEFDMLTLMGAEINSGEIEAYKKLFIQEGWLLHTDSLFEHFYRFKKTIEHEGITKHVTADLYALEETYDEEQDLYIYDFSLHGKFYLDIHDRHYYEWPTNEFQSLVQTIIGVDVIIPAYEDASRYIVTTTADTEVPIIYAYTDAEDPEADYEDILVSAGWAMTNDNYKIAIHSSNDIGVQFAYDQEEGCLKIAAVGVYPSSPSEPIDPELISLVEQINTNIATAGYDFRLEWDDNYGHYSSLADFGPSTDESEANLKATTQTIIDLIPSTGLNVKYDEYNDPASGGVDILADGTITYSYVLANEEETFAIQIITFVFEGNLYASIAAYSIVY